MDVARLVAAGVPFDAAAAMTPGRAAAFLEGLAAARAEAGA